MLVLTAAATGAVGSLAVLVHGQSERTVTRHPETADVPHPAEHSAVLSRAATGATAATPTKDQAGSGSGRKADANRGGRSPRMVTW
jgi:hypothetical protein